EWWQAFRVPAHGHPGSRRGLARSDIGDAVDLREAVAAVPGEAQRPASGRDLARPEDRDRHRVARLERDRAPVDDDPAGPLARALAGPFRGRGLGHWRIRVPAGSNSGSGWRRAGRRRPMISISNLPSAASSPSPPAVASRDGTYPSAIDRLTWWP